MLDEFDRRTLTPLPSMYIEADEKSRDEKKSNGIEETASSEYAASDIDNDAVYSLNEQRSIIHRIDRRLVTICGISYCFSIIDRGNLGNASIAGSVLHLPGSDRLLASC